MCEFKGSLWYHYCTLWFTHDPPQTGSLSSPRKYEEKGVYRSLLFSSVLSTFAISFGTYMSLLGVDVTWNLYKVDDNFIVLTLVIIRQRGCINTRKIQLHE